jgi:hypothetical protein
MLERNACDAYAKDSEVVLSQRIVSAYHTNDDCDYTVRADYLVEFSHVLRWKMFGLALLAWIGAILLRSIHLLLFQWLLEFGDHFFRRICHFYLNYLLSSF